MRRPRRPRVRKQRTRNRMVALNFRVFSLATGAFKYNDGPYHFALDSLTDWTVKPGNMSRVLYERGSDLVRISPGDDCIVYCDGGQPGGYLDPRATMSVWLPYANRLKTSKLPTSNKANLLTFFAEFDDTIAMLGKNIVKSATYGGVKWGWMPLVSDIMACNDAGNAIKESVLEGNRRTVKYNANSGIMKNSGPIPCRGGLVRHEWDVSVKHRGHVSYDNDICAFYDYLGFHPTPKLAWDLIPLSFALDYILPIGDILKALTPVQGWVKSVNFTGWRVIRAKCTEVVIEPAFHMGRRLSGEVAAPVTYVWREYCSDTVLEQKQIPAAIEVIKTPTWEQAFDLTYLADAFYNRGRKLLAPHVYKKRKR